MFAPLLKPPVAQPLGDPLERQADQLAEHAVSAQQHTAVGGIPPAIPRFSGRPHGTVAAMPASVGQVLAGPGRPLEPKLRKDMEYHLGHDFSGVRVHLSAAAEQSARDLNAHAYTVGDNIVFGPGQFAPATQHGRRLLAHELTHVAQQSQFGAAEKVAQRKGELSALPPIVLSLLSDMDVQGEMILGTYLYGGGTSHDVEDPIWTAYMMEDRDLRLQILARLIPAVREIAGRQQKGRYPLAETFHGEFHQNNGLSGYALLHGSNKDAGDFQLLGWADVDDAVDPAEGDWDIELELRFVFNDIVDPNSNYWSDRVRSFVATVVTSGQAQSYHLSIHWSSRCLAEVRGQQIVYSGYPSDRSRGIRPLPRGRLDLADLEKKRAKGIESDIIKELQQSIAAGDVESLAARKQRLLWLFYRLSGYWGSTYLERISNARPEDGLPRLLHSRLSGGLRAELMEALRGKRPQGDPP